MANDIKKSVPDNDIKNGSVLTVYSKKRFYTQNDYVVNNPTITDIENKYDNRFDKTTYYTIGNTSILGV